MRRSITRIAVVLALACAGADESALAQTPGGALPQGQIEGERPRRATERARRLLSTAEEAALFRPLRPEERASFDEVLARPDDIDLNVRWARTQIDAGDVRGAAATLERVLLLQPDLSLVRLLYVAVLLRLDVTAEAAAQLDRIDPSALPLDLRAEAARHRAEIERRSRRTRGWAALTGGTVYDTNRTAGPLSDDALYFDQSFELDETGRADDDWAFLGVIETGVEHDLGLAEGHTLFASVDGYVSEQADLHRFDLRSYAGRGGADLRLFGGHARPALFGSFIELSSETYLKTLGAEIELERAFGPKLEAYGRLRVELEDFDGVSSSTDAADRAGFRSELIGGAGLELSAAHRIDAILGLVNKSAERRYYGYGSAEATLQHRWLPGGGQFVLTGFALGYASYKDAQTEISHRVRRDTWLRPRVTWGAPLGFFGSFVPEIARPIVVSASVELLRNFSNLSNYDWKTTRVTLLASRRFDF